ncbi:MAG: prolyl aminopeptidase [Pseudomonadota bacterium]|nr:prolyl aminopeptidase [Pseudomonadota bacterium]
MNNELWPHIEPYNHFYIKIDQHNIYVEECGNPNGIPIIFLHGGPGGGCLEVHRRLFNPKQCRIILFDQRGCGRSVPNASIENNTPNHIVEDMEQIRQILNIDKFHLFGGSWGTTLALLYAIKYPKHVDTMILRGVFLGTKKEIDWIYEPNGCANFHPEAYKHLVSDVETEKSIVHQFYTKLINMDESYAKKWAIWEAINSGISVDQKTIDSFTEPKLAMSLARISTHYFANELFIEENFIINHLDPIREIKTTIVQGGLDLLCPPKAANTLANQLNNANLFILQDAGHSLFEASILKRMLNILSDNYH